MKKWYFREANYRTLRDLALIKQKGTSKGAFYKMVPLKKKVRCALHCASFALLKTSDAYKSASSILRRIIPALRFRTFVAPERPLLFIDTNAKGTLKSAPLHWCR